MKEDMGCGGRKKKMRKIGKGGDDSCTPSRSAGIDATEEEEII